MDVLIPGDRAALLRASGLQQRHWNGDHSFGNNIIQLLLPGEMLLVSTLPGIRLAQVKCEMKLRLKSDAR